MKYNTDFSRATLGVLLFSVISSAHAGWYDVQNYAGTIGDLPVHLSIQMSDNSRESHVDGSYYYDAHRTPIPLQGKRLADGSLQLCEAGEPATFGDSPKVPEASATHPVPCPISLSVNGEQASGEWRDGKKNLPISLHQIGSLNDTGDSPRLGGTVEIPMWHHTKHYLLLGVYESASDCPLSMSRLRLVDIKSGRVDKELKFPCGTGTVSTPIYANVYRAQNPRNVTVIFQGGYHGMGDDRDIAVER